MFHGWNTYISDLGVRIRKFITIQVVEFALTYVRAYALDCNS
jgi:hypothetical protein